MFIDSCLFATFRMATTRTSIVPALILFIFVFAVFGMAATGPGSTTTPIDPPVADPSVQQRAVRKKRQKRMVYGFTFSHKELLEWGKQHVGDVDDKEVLGHDKVRRSMGPLFTRCLRLWYRTTVHMVRYYSGPRRHQADWCLTLADNISPDTATPPPREVIDEIKEALEITRDPEWHLFGGD
ncbi:hypothetical protein EDB84DRAFT_1491459 [Lactarius hengduanensis]|nr:hypothetical protein EDB85DRAFT_1958881 [Lactarius pseudohatsudake]KAH9031941.1 hypothetical protein EDB84DRAFT_1491459 [Lactarius hengduanensis]